jgi:hypothetical protein
MTRAHTSALRLTSSILTPGQPAEPEIERGQRELRREPASVDGGVSARVGDPGGLQTTRRRTLLNGSSLVIWRYLRVT